jgi:HTH domain
VGRLAGKLGVSERAARQYVGILREADIAVESVRGPARTVSARRSARLAR